MIPDAQMQLVRESAEANDLGAHFDQICALVRPSLLLATSPALDEQLACGSTKIGGDPDLPDDVAWPSWHGKPMRFLGQINLEEITPYSLGLPQQGLLQFFFTEDWDATSPQCSGAGTVQLVPVNRSKRRRRASEPDSAFRSSSVKYIPYPSLPSINGQYYGDLWGLTFVAQEADLCDAYENMVDGIKDALGIGALSTQYGYNYHQLLGYPRPVQGHLIEVEIERGRSGTPYPLPLSADGITWCQELQLLFMLQEDEHAGIRLIDSGRIYFAYPAEQLQSHDFSQPWTMLDYG